MTGSAARAPEGVVAPVPRRLDIPSLDGIRAVAFGIVFLGHAGLGDVVPGGFGVTVFFFLSGYLITTLLRIEFERHGTVSLRRFYMRRALRILPPFYVALGLAIALTLFAILPGPLRPEAVWAQVLYWANYWIIGNTTLGQPLGTGVYWSLAVEEHFYLLFPLLFLVLQRRRLGPRQQAIVLWSICGLVLAWRAVLAYALGAAGDRTYMASDTRIDSILFGCALAVYANPALDADAAVPPRVWKFALLPAGLAVLLFSFAYRDVNFRESLRYTLQGLALVPVFMVAVRWSDWGVFRLLNVSVVRFVGVLSYSLYLVHQVFLYAVQRNLSLPPIVSGVLALALSLLVATVIHVVVERPAAGMRRRFDGSSAQPAPHGAVASPTRPATAAGAPPSMA